MAMEDQEKTEEIGCSMGSTRFITAFKRAMMVLGFPLKSIKFREQTLNTTASPQDLNLRLVSSSAGLLCFGP